MILISRNEKDWHVGVEIFMGKKCIKKTRIDKRYYCCKLQKSGNVRGVVTREGSGVGSVKLFNEMNY